MWPSKWHSRTGDRIKRYKLKIGKESDRVRGTYELESMSGGTSQDTGTIRLSKGDSHPRDRMGGQIRTQKESGRARSTHLLVIASGGAQVRTREECSRARAAHQLETESGGIN